MNDADTKSGDSASKEWEGLFRDAKEWGEDIGYLGAHCKELRNGFKLLRDEYQAIAEQFGKGPLSEDRIKLINSHLRKRPKDYDNE